jgi:hypothetical protein
VLYDTIDTIGPDGEVVMSEPRPITVGEQRAQNLARRYGDEPAVAANGFGLNSGEGTQDFACLNDSLWVYSRMDYSGDRICFHDRNSEFIMSHFDRYVVINGRKYYAGTWRIPSGSYLVGARGGYFAGYDNVTGSVTYQTFSPSAFFGTFEFLGALDYIVQY